MNKIIVAAALLLSGYTSSAQSEAHQIEATVGIGTGVINDLFYNSSYKAGAVYFAGAKYYISDKVALGIGAGVCELTDQYYSHNKYASLTVCAEMNVVYYSRYRVQFYGTFGLGANHINGLKSSSGTSGTITSPEASSAAKATSLSGTISPLCLRIGGTHALFFELGFGYKGVISGGYSLRLGHREKAKVKPPVNTGVDKK